jgi:hypothetical protein
LVGPAVGLMVCYMGKDSSFVHCSPIFEMGMALDVPKVFLRR